MPNMVDFVNQTELAAHPFEELKRSLDRVWNHGPSAEHFTGDTAWLNGRSTDQLRRSVSREIRRENGMFPTGATKSAALVHQLSSLDTKDAKVLDPACGTGDLLLSIAKRLPISETPDRTLENWGQVLHGWDLTEDLVEIARWRLALLAVVRCGKAAISPMDLQAMLPEVKVLDGIEGLRSESKFTHIVLNPPFAQVPTIVDGKTLLISLAATFVECAVDALTDDGQLAALLPDVIRSGTRYSELRSDIRSKGSIDSLLLQDQFDFDADVHTFTMAFRRGDPSSQSVWGTEQMLGDSRTKIGDMFNISVGPVVPHRHPNKGPWARYISAGSLRGAVEYNSDTAKSRRFKGTVSVPPFVAIKRTSRPGDNPRASATLITGSKPVAVENHLIIAKPNKGGLEKCQELVEMLHSDHTNSALDQRIRCRHLTVISIRGLLWP